MTTLIVTLITVAATLLVPFITFYLERKDLPRVGGIESKRGRGVSVSPTAKIVIVSIIALVLAVPVGLIAYCLILTFNLLVAPPERSVWLYSWMPD